MCVVGVEGLGGREEDCELKHCEAQQRMSKTRDCLMQESKESFGERIDCNRLTDKHHATMCFVLNTKIVVFVVVVVASQNPRMAAPFQHSRGHTTTW